MTAAVTDDYLRTILEVAARDASIARVLREICALDGATRAAALGLVAAHLRTRRVDQGVLDCIAMLRQDAVAQRISEVLPPTSSG